MEVSTKTKLVKKLLFEWRDLTLLLYLGAFLYEFQIFLTGDITELLERDRWLRNDIQKYKKLIKA